jgi:exopolysaccharide production protein ExoQ
MGNYLNNSYNTNENNLSVNRHEYYFKKLETFFCVFTLIFYSGGVSVLLGRDFEWINTLTRVLYYVIPMLTIFLLSISWRSVITLVVKEKFLWFLIAFMIMSVLWSAMPKTTISHSYGLVRVTLFSIYLAARFSIKEQVRILGISFGITVVLCLLFGILMPEYGIMGLSSTFTTPEDKGHVGAWQGIFTHKNILGRFMVLSIIIFLSYRSSSKLYWLRWLGIGTSVLLIVLSTSKTSLLILLTMFTLLPILGTLRWKYSWKIPFITSIILLLGTISTFVMENSEVILSALGRDATLSGRTKIWGEVIWAISKHPWIGYGYEGFWRKGTNADYVWNALKFKVTHSHNGFLELWLQLGIIGLSLYIIAFLIACYKAVVFLHKNNSSEGIYPLMLLIFIFLANITESSLLGANTYLILFISVTLTLNNNKQYKLADLRNTNYMKTSNSMSEFKT